MAVTVRFDGSPRDQLLEHLVGESELSANEVLKRLAYLGYLASRHTNMKFVRGLVRRDELGALRPVDSIPEDRLSEVVGTLPPVGRKRPARRASSARSSEAVRTEPPAQGGKGVQDRGACQLPEAPAGGSEKSSPVKQGSEPREAPDWVEDLVRVEVEDDGLPLETESPGGAASPKGGSGSLKKLAEMFPQFEDEG